MPIQEILHQQPMKINQDYFKKTNDVIETQIFDLSQLEKGRKL